MLLVRLRVRFKTSCAFNVKSNLHLTKGLNRIKENKSGELKSLSLQKSIKYSLHTLFNFSATKIMSDKMNQKTYECRQCHKLTIGYPALYRNQCLAWRNLEIRNIIEKERYRTLSKQELVQENKKLTDKMRNLKDVDLFDNDISSPESFEDDPDYLPESPNLKKTKSLISKSVEKSVEKNISETSDNEDEQITNIEQSINTSGSDDSGKSIKNITKKSTYRKIAFRKLYKGPKRFYPGEKLHCSFQITSDIELDDESANVLKSMLSTKKRKITEKIQQLFPEKKVKL